MPDTERKVVECTPWPPEPRRRRPSRSDTVNRIRQERTSSTRSLTGSSATPRRNTTNSQSSTVSSTRRNSRDAQQAILASSGRSNRDVQSGTIPSPRRRSRDLRNNNIRQNSWQQFDSGSTPPGNAESSSGGGGGNKDSPLARKVSKTKDVDESNAIKIASEMSTNSTEAEAVEHTTMMNLLDNLSTLLLEKTYGSRIDNYAHLPGVVTRLQWEFRELKQENHNMSKRLQEQNKELAQLKDLVDKMDFESSGETPDVPKPSAVQEGNLLFASTIKLEDKYLSVAVIAKGEKRDKDTHLAINAFDCETADTYTCEASAWELAGKAWNDMLQGSEIEETLLEDILKCKLRLEGKDGSFKLVVKSQ